MDTRLLRAVGAATGVYGLAVMARPDWLARPSGLIDADHVVPDHVRASLRPVGLRDAASGFALVAAPEGPALRTAAAVRLAADLGDAVVLGATLPRSRRVPAVMVSVGWAAVTVVALLRRSRTYRPVRQ